MKRLSVLCLLVLGLGGGDATAGDEIKVLGFSSNGRYFAFERRGSTEAGTYSLLSAMDVAGNRTVQGGQIGYSDDDRKQLAKVRSINARMLRKLKIVQKGFMTVSIRGIDFEPFEDAAVKSLALPAKWFGPESYLVLREMKLVTQRCADGKASPTGFSLALERKDAPPVRLNHDVAVTAERGCPTHYSVAEAHALRLKDGDTALAAIVQYLNLTAGAPDRRYMAVTARIPR